MSDIDLIIFDCDGVLIDSEMLVCTLVSEELTRLGYPITPEQVVERYAGRPEREILALIAADWGQPVPPAYKEATTRRIREAFTSELQAIPEVAATLARISIPICVASSSGPEKLKLGLSFVSLYDYFAPNVVSAAYVAHGKPSPDVFIYAAGTMHTPVNRCLVIEDSLPGVRAAVAAGMRVFGFTGGSHCPPGHAARLLESGAERVLEAMGELEQALPSAFDAALPGLGKQREEEPAIVGRR
jgi:HAD superfamily hydrolase (TIGR01509 family)